MRKISVLLILAALILLPANLHAAKAEKGRQPLLVVFGYVDSGGAPVGLEITVAVTEQLAKSKRFEILRFNPEVPALTRAAMEHRISDDMLKNAWEWKNAAVIAGVLKAQYALCIKGSGVTGTATVTLDLVELSSARHWTSTAESVIAVSEGSRQAQARKNAISTASSSAVTQILLEAFSTQEPLLPEKPVAEPEPAISAPTQPTTPPVAPGPTMTVPPISTPGPPPVEVPTESNTVAPSAMPEATAPTAAAPPTSTPEKPADARDVAEEYAAVIKQVDADQAKNDFGGMLIGLRKAVNLMPSDAKTRMRLANLYASLGMTGEAADECSRALLYDKNSIEIRSALVKLYVSVGSLDKATEQCQEIIRMQPENIEAQLALGDLLWNQARVDEALHAYQNAVAQEPKNALAHGRLQKLFAAKKMYPQALEQLIAVKTPSADDEPDAEKRYLALSHVIRDEFKAVKEKLQAARRDFESGTITREECYQDCKETVGRVEALANYLSVHTSPAKYREAHSHAVLAVSLMAQTSGYMVSYLETEKQYYKDQSSLLEAEAITEMNQYADLFGPEPSPAIVFPSASVIVPAE